MMHGQGIDHLDYRLKHSAWISLYPRTTFQSWCSQVFPPQKNIVAWDNSIGEAWPKQWPWWITKRWIVFGKIWSRVVYLTCIWGAREWLRKNGIHRSCKEGAYRRYVQLCTMEQKRTDGDRNTERHLLEPFYLGFYFSRGSSMRARWVHHERAAGWSDRQTDVFSADFNDALAILQELLEVCNDAKNDHRH
jgi:hypothetical protein